MTSASLFSICAALTNENSDDRWAEDRFMYLKRGELMLITVSSWFGSIALLGSFMLIGEMNSGRAYYDHKFNSYLHSSAIFLYVVACSCVISQEDLKRGSKNIDDEALRDADTMSQNAVVGSSLEKPHPHPHPQLFIN